MQRSAAEIAESTLLCLLAGYALWPPGNVYWTAVADVLGPAPTMAIVLVLAGLVGAATTLVGRVDPVAVGIGGAVAYVVGMVLVEVLVTPDSPVHLVLYAAMLACAVVGATVATRVTAGPHPTQGGTRR